MVEIEDSTAIFVEPASRFGERDPASPPAKERDPKLFFDPGDALAHGRLADPQGGRRFREAAPLRGTHERREVRNLGIL